jgi:catechol 2,3-dioxygenase-like lactoylglutathione lyase family enzyme
MIISQLGHEQINVQTKNLSFYKDLFTFLGWKVVCDEAANLGVLDKNGASLWFTAPLKEVHNDYDGVGMNHLAIAVGAQADVDAAVTYLKAHNVKALFDTPRHRPDFCADAEHTYYQVMFESPDRILFEIVFTGIKS